MASAEHTDTCRIHMPKLFKGHTQWHTIGILLACKSETWSESVIYATVTSVNPSPVSSTARTTTKKNRSPTYML